MCIGSGWANKEDSIISLHSPKSFLLNFPAPANVNFHGLLIPWFSRKQQEPGVRWLSQADKCQDRFSGIFRSRRHAPEKSHQTIFCMLRCLKSLQTPALLSSVAARAVWQAADSNPSTQEQSLPVCRGYSVRQLIPLCSDWELHGSVIIPKIHGWFEWHSSKYHRLDCLCRKVGTCALFSCICAGTRHTR